MKKSRIKILNLILSAVMVTGIVGSTTFKVFAAESQTPYIVSEGTFEDGTANGWVPRGSAAIAAITEDKASGNKCLKVTGRTAAWNGPSIDLKNKLEVGKTYEVSLKIKVAAGQATAGAANTEQKVTVSMLRKATSDTKDSYDSIAYQKVVNEENWTTITGKYTVPTADSFEKLTLYVESPNATLSFYIDDFTLTGEAPIKPTEIQKDIPSLGDSLKDYFKIGGAINPADLGSNGLREQLIKKHYNTLVAENVMKPDALQKTEGNFNFTNADKLVDFAIANNMEMRGHTLVWHSQIPAWFFQDPKDPTKPASKELLLQRERTHITTVLRHFKEKYGDKNPIKAWDVVNEVISDDGNYRQSDWYKIAGIDYIAEAFKVAREVDPSMKLYINDYNIERNNSKTQKFYEVVKELLAKGVPVDGIGMQMHVATDTSLEAIETSIEKFASLGLPIQVTELDVKIAGTINQDAYINQARYYKQILDIFKKHKDVINTVVFWGVTDDTSWIEEDPLLFNDKFQAKPAFFAITDPSKVSVNRKATQAVAGTPVLRENADKLWSTVKYFKVDSFVKGFSGAKGTAQAMWDSKNLYLKIRVADSTKGSKDSIELFIDKNNAKSENYQPDDKHYIIYRDNSLNSELSPIIAEDAEGYTVQLAIPLDEIKPELGKTIGFDIRINDDKSTGEVDSIVVLNDFGNRQDINTAYFSDLKLEPASKIFNAVKGTPTIDGVKDEIWSKSAEMSTNTWVTGTSGATAKSKVMWDDKNLYILAEVKDDLLNKDSKNAHEQDSIEVFLDQNNEKTTSYQADDGQFRVNFNNEQSFGGSTDKTGFKSATKVNGTNYVVEMGIPLSKVKVENGTIVGFDLQVNNADTTGKRVSVAMWCDPTGNSWASTLNYGNLMLVEATNSQVIAAELVEKALAEKDFYNFNIAYGSVIGLSDEKTKAQLLDKLAEIQDAVWTEDIKNAVTAVVNAGNKLDADAVNKAEEAIAKVVNTNNKEYLLGEINNIKAKIK